ncbi:hypothetical protein ABT072_45620 [Streptomyces sp. NPDC002589]|uniref:hypothetical protein n=1 Tax=Streptomyces sp. NPDC002589 TaxID=3154420 RepID=UPI0033165860
MSGREGTGRRVPFWAIGYALCAVVWIPVFLAAGGPERVPDLIPYAVGSLALAITAGALADRARAHRRSRDDRA